MPTINLVTTDSVRAVLGVSAKELPDTVLANSIYSVRLKEAILDLHPQMLADFNTVSGLDSPTSDQQRFLDLMETYAAYNVAQQCLISLPMFSPMTIQDEKAALIRNANAYAQLKADVGDVLTIIRVKLQTVYVAINPSALAPTPIDRVFMVGVSLGSDPVTGS